MPGSNDPRNDLSSVNAGAIATESRTTDPVPDIFPILERATEQVGSVTIFDNNDVVQKVKRTIGDFLADKTKNNYYPIQEGSTPVKLHEANGVPSALNDKVTGAKKTFFTNFTSNKAQTDFDGTSRSGYLDTNNSLFTIKKGLSNESIQSGQDIINDINTNLDNSAFSKRVQESLQENNRFNANNTFIPTQGTTITEDADNNVSIGIVQKELGVHYPRKQSGAASKSALASEAPTLLKIKDLKKLGALMMLKASGEAFTPTDPSDITQGMVTARAVNVPGLARLGQRVPMSRFSPANILSSIDPNFSKPELNVGFSTKEIYSYGNVNNYLVPFTSFSGTAAIVSAGLLIATVTAMIEAIVAIIGTTSAVVDNIDRAMSTTTDIFSGNSSGDYNEKKKKRLGSYIEKTKSLVPAINTTVTYHDFFAAVNKGITIFFGNNIGIGQVDPNSVSQLAGSSGFYNVILRNIVRSVSSDFLNLLSLGGTPAPGSISPGFAIETPGGQLGSLDALDPITMVAKFNSSPLLKFINILANIGDQALLLEDQGYNVGSIGGLDIRDISEIDKISETTDDGRLNLGILHSKNRLSTRLNTLAWNSTSTPSLYWFPQQVLNGAQNYFGNKTNGISIAKSAISDKTVSTGSLEGRISPDDVVALENELEAEYMPFYFQDLRTNEIISFHAFIEELGDSFSSDYEESEGYGRVGGVHTYKNTKRTINLSFRVVATSPEDFDQMWWKINKFITLVYPQYSEGRRLKDSNNNQFIQPFSQVPTSSPLVRLRLGDLFKTNYSKFALARLFGVATSYFQLNNNNSTNGSSNNTDSNSDAEATRQFEANVNSVRGRMMGTVAGQARFNPGEFAFLAPNGQPGATGIIRAYKQIDSITSNAGPAAGLGSLVNSLGSVFSLSSTRGLIIFYTARVRIVSLGTTANTFNVSLENPLPGQEGIYVVSSEYLTSDPSEYVRIASSNINSGDVQTTLTTNAGGLPTTQDFFSEGPGTNENAIFKSFTSTKGKGLAGFIKNINFDYDLNQTTWETARFNARAPMMLKVTMEFIPVHDIQPGIDQHGLNTAPVYNVGEIVKNFNKDQTGPSAGETNFNTSRGVLGKFNGNGRGF